MQTLASEVRMLAEIARRMRYIVTVWRIDGDTARFVTANEAARPRLPKDPNELVGSALHEVAPSASPALPALLAETLGARTPKDLGDAVGSDNRIYARVAVQVAEDCVAIVAEDVTERRASEEAFAAANRYLDSIVENIPNMIFVKEAKELRFERLNRAGEELLGISRGALFGKNDYDFFPKDQADFFQAQDRETLHKGDVVDIPEEPIQTPKGERWLHTRKIPMVDDEGRPSHLLGISWDITDERRTKQELEQARIELTASVEARTAELTKAHEALRSSEEKLRQTQKMEAIGRLAGGVAHDFNNMLSVILSFTSFALADLSEKDPIRDDLIQVLGAAERAAQLTKQLLAFSRQQVLKPRPTDLNGIVTEMEKMLKRVLGEDVELRKRLATARVRANVDPSQMEQVLMNLAVNARDAMPKGGKLTIETSHVHVDEAYARDHLNVTPGPHVMLAVTDTGIGMDKDTQSRIFEPFFTTKEKGKGTGLGLSMVLGIVQQSGGAIWVYSELGKGTTFKVYFPELVDEAVAESARARAPDGTGGSETILLVEDEDLVRKAARAALRRLGYTILEASNAGEALLLCERFSGTIHLMLTDVVMPTMSGRELAERLSQIRPEIRVLYMSGYTDDTIFHHGMLHQDISFLQKPFTPDGLTSKVREVLDSPPRSRDGS